MKWILWRSKIVRQWIFGYWEWEGIQQDIITAQQWLDLFIIYEWANDECMYFVGARSITKHKCQRLLGRYNTRYKNFEKLVPIATKLILLWHWRSLSDPIAINLRFGIHQNFQWTFLWHFIICYGVSSFETVHFTVFEITPLTSNSEQEGSEDLYHTSEYVLQCAPLNLIIIDSNWHQLEYVPRYVIEYIPIYYDKYRGTCHGMYSGTYQLVIIWS
jgi:hypothetical protein